MNSLVRIAEDIYQDDRFSSGHDGFARARQFESIIEELEIPPLEVTPDPAAPVIAARLLHELVTRRKNLFFNPGPAWALVETYLLMNGLAVTASDDEIEPLLESMRREGVRLDSALRFISEKVEAIDCLGVTACA